MPKIPSIRPAITGLGACLVLGAAFSAPGAAHADVAHFTARFEADRSVEWDQPRSVAAGDCNGDRWARAFGSETWKIRSKPVKVTVTRAYGRTTWVFGSGREPADPRKAGIPGTSAKTREYTYASGTEGGWCGGPKQDPRPKTDCGTRLPAVFVVILADRRELDWYVNPAPWMANERIDFYDCRLDVPKGLAEGSMPDLRWRFKTADLFKRRKRTIVLRTVKDYGPTSFSGGAPRTSRGKASAKLKLVRR